MSVVRLVWRGAKHTTPNEETDQTMPSRRSTNQHDCVPVLCYPESGLSAFVGASCSRHQPSDGIQARGVAIQALKSSPQALGIAHDRTDTVPSVRCQDTILRAADVHTPSVGCHQATICRYEIVSG